MESTKSKTENRDLIELAQLVAIVTLPMEYGHGWHGLPHVRHSGKVCCFFALGWRDKKSSQKTYHL
jgi:hypothetical protein